jgi:hypothetical protein
VLVRSISAVAVARSAILALTRLSVRLLRVSVISAHSSSVAGVVAVVWEKMYEFGEGTNVALAKRAAAETEGSTIAAIDGLSFFFLPRRDFGRSALDCLGVNHQMAKALLFERELTRDAYDMLYIDKLVLVS